MEDYTIQSHLQIKIKDEAFDVDLISQFDLCIQFQVHSFDLCVIDTNSQRCLLLESYKLPNYPDKSFEELISSIFEDHHFLMAGFWKNVKISFSNKQFSLVPATLFEESVREKYLTCHTSLDPQIHSVFYYKHSNPDAYNVFAGNSKIISSIKGFYSENKIKVVHHSSSLINGIMREQQSISLRTLYLFFQKDNFTLVIKRENSLEYCNTFSFSSPDEFIFYLMFVSTTLNINRKNSQLILFGDIDKESVHYSRLLQYFKFISFGTKPANLKFGYVFDEVADHQFFDLFSIYLC